MTKAAIYARSSTTMAPEHLIESQLRLCRDRAAIMGWPVARSLLDGEPTGMMDGASGPESMLARAGKFDVLLAKTLDRVSRQPEHVATLERRRSAGCRLETVAECRIDGTTTLTAGVPT